MIIYLHRNTINRKAYIGQTKTIQHSAINIIAMTIKVVVHSGMQLKNIVGINFLIQFQKMHRNTTLCQTTISKNCKNKGTISVHKVNKNYTWMYLTDYLNC